jgi:hypothetical protein
MRITPLIALGLAATTAVAGGAATAQAEPQKATFNVSLYGVQHYDDHSVKRENPAMLSFDDRGTVDSRSVVTFHTTRPVRAVLTRQAGSISIRWLGDDEMDLPVIADFTHSGETVMEQRTGIVAGGPQWEIVPPPLAANCSATLDNLGFGLSLSGSRVTASATSSIVVPVKDPFNGCPYGDRSGGLYSAKGRTSPSALMEGRETEMILRGKDHSHYDYELSTSDTRKRTTIYVTFRRLG